MKKLTIKLTWLLGIEFILGMLANLYEEVLSDAPEQAFRHIGYISLHAALAVAIVLVALWLGWLAYKTKTAVLTNLLGLASVLIASLSGHLFVVTGQDGYSVAMAIAFLAAFSCYLYQAVALPAKD